MRCIVGDLAGAFCMRAVRTAVERSMCLDSVPDDFAAAVFADRREFLNSALERIENVRATGGNHLKGQLIFVSAHFAFRHRYLPGEILAGQLPATLVPTVRAFRRSKQMQARHVRPSVLCSPDFVTGRMRVAAWRENSPVSSTNLM